MNNESPPRGRLARANIFAESAPAYFDAGFSVTPLNGKRPLEQGWQKHLNGPPKVDTRNRWLRDHASANIGLLTGGPIGGEFRLIGFDVDDDKLVRVASVITGNSCCAKKGKKGLTLFCRVAKDTKVKSTQFRDAANVGKVDILFAGKQTVLPESVHPETGKPYVWIGKSLLACDPLELPLNSEAELKLLRVVVSSKYLNTIQGGVATHEAGVAFAAQLVTAGASDDKIEAIFNALLPEGYKGNSLKELPEWIESARKEGFGTRVRSSDYDPGQVGPIALGRDGDEFYLRCQQTNEVVRRSPRQLTTVADLCALCPLQFWLESFPKILKNGVVSGVDTNVACDALIQACTKKGHLDVTEIRGFGVWPDEGRLVVNTGETTIESTRFVYSHPRIRPTAQGKPFDPDLALEFMRLGNWAQPSSPEILLGWSFSAVVTGALSWRPHMAISGAASSGKSTEIKMVTNLLSPAAIVLEGISTEAGIRQNIGHDARPCIIDELEAENSGDTPRIQRIVKLMRSASSATGSVARGTQEGRPVNYCTRASFLVGAINVYKIGAADTSRVIRLELNASPKNPQARARVLQLLKQCEGMGPDFVKTAIEHAQDILDSIIVIHAAMPAIQDRQADNLATVLAGYWVATKRRVITPAQAAALVKTHKAAIQAQHEASDENDATECLNVLLAHVIDRENGRSIGSILSDTLYSKVRRYADFGYDLRSVGIKIEADGFLVATSHPGLRQIYRGTRWESGVWGSALERLPGSKSTPQRRFADGVRSRAVWISKQEIPAPDSKRFDDVGF